MNTHFGLTMRQFRQAAGLDQQTLAYRIGCDKHLINNVEMNLKPPPGEFLIAWANELRIMPEQIILMWLNQQGLKMMKEAGIAVPFKIVAATWEEVGYDEANNMQGRTPRPHREMVNRATTRDEGGGDRSAW